LSLSIGLNRPVIVVGFSADVLVDGPQRPGGYHKRPRRMVGPFAFRSISWVYVNTQEVFSTPAHRGPVL